MSIFFREIHILFKVETILMEERQRNNVYLLINVMRC